MSIEEQNKLISEFEFPDIQKEIEAGYIMLDNVYKKSFIITHDYASMKYHSSWDWLMPVVQRICELWGSSSIIDMQLLDEDVSANKIKHLRIWSSIESAYECAIDFITWYNTQNK